MRDATGCLVEVRVREPGPSICSPGGCEWHGRRRRGCRTDQRQRSQAWIGSPRSRQELVDATSVDSRGREKAVIWRARAAFPGRVDAAVSSAIPVATAINTAPLISMPGGVSTASGWIAKWGWFIGLIRSFGRASRSIRPARRCSGRGNVPIGNSPGRARAIAGIEFPRLRRRVPNSRIG